MDKNQEHSLIETYIFYFYRIKIVQLVMKLKM